MIYFYSGTPGSGKSLHVARDIYWKLRKEDWVFANFSINFDTFKSYKRKYKFFGKKIEVNDMKGVFIERDNSKLRPEWFMEFAEQYFRRNERGQIVEGQAFLVLDEAGKLFNPRDWGVPNRNAWIDFFAQHRKYGYTIYIIAQSDRMIDRQIRALFEYEVKHRKLNNYKFFGNLLGKMAGGALFMAITYWYAVKERIDSETFALKDLYIHFYDSYKTFGNKKNMQFYKGCQPNGQVGGAG